MYQQSIQRDHLLQLNFKQPQHILHEVAPLFQTTPI